jgi:hypothetical protein
LVCLGEVLRRVYSATPPPFLQSKEEEPTKKAKEKSSIESSTMGLKQDSEEEPTKKNQEYARFRLLLSSMLFTCFGI